MKNKIFFFIILTSFFREAAAQTGSTDNNWTTLQDSVVYTNKKYVGINTDLSLYPQLQQGLQVKGNLLIQQLTYYTRSQPTTAQTLTMSNSYTGNRFSAADSTGRMFDPGGPGVNYTNTMEGNIFISHDDALIGYNLSFNTNDYGLAAGDTLWLSKVGFPNCRTDYFQRFTNSTLPPQHVNISHKGFLSVLFRSNADNNNSKGFDITWRKIFPVAGATTISSVGNTLLFNSYSGAFSAGVLSTSVKGNASTSLGYQTNGRGYYTTATGYMTNATGDFSTALGSLTTSWGNTSTAMGFETLAYGPNSTAMGSNSKALGRISTAMGVSTTAHGTATTTMGQGTVASSFASVAMGIYNDSITTFANSTYSNEDDPLLIIGNGNSTRRNNAFVVYKNGNTDINGYTQLGKATEAAPAIKMKKLNTTTAATQDGMVKIPHGLNRAKILGVQILLTYIPNTADIPATYLDVPGYEFNWQVNYADINIYNKRGNSANILNKPVRILITYEE